MSSVEQERENLVRAERQAHADGRARDPRGPGARSRTCSISSCARGSRTVEELGPQVELLQARSATRSACSASSELRARRSSARPRSSAGSSASNKTVDRRGAREGRRDAARGRGRARPRARGRCRAAPTASRRPARPRPTTQQRHVTQAVMRECIVNLAQDQGSGDPARRPARRRAGARPSEAAAARHHRGPADARQDEGACKSSSASARVIATRLRAERRDVASPSISSGSPTRS